MITPAAISVSQLNMYVKSLIEGEPNLRAVLVNGEISNYTRNTKSGHAYFSLKDGQSSVKAVMFNSAASKISFIPKDGMRVFVIGRVSLYERDGMYQLYIEKIVPDGIGGEYLAFLQLKEKLDNEGLFDSSHKKKLPKYPCKIGLITSETGAAVKDFCSIVERRYPNTEIIIYGCLVQGQDCSKSVTRGIKYFNDKTDVDVLVITRGGGSYEDLSGFNDESLAREVYNSKIPTVSAIGHEVDYTIIDFVADMRAPTPSAAAEIVTPNREDLLLALLNMKKVAKDIVISRFEDEKMFLDDCRNRLDITSLIEKEHKNLDYMLEKIKSNSKNSLQRYFFGLDNTVNKINALSPLSVLSRGYSLVYCEEHLVKSVSDVEKGDNVKIRVKDGEINCYAE